VFDTDAFQRFEAAGWEEVAEGYAASGVVADLTNQAAVAMVEAVGAGPGRRILDLACGPGPACREAVDRGAEAVGVDIAEAMVAVAGRAVPEAEFRRSPAESLPFGDESFDAVVCGFGLPHFADPEAVFAEVHRVLRPKGSLAFTTWCVPDKVPFFGVVFTAVVEHGTVEVDLPDGPDMFRFAAEQEAKDVLGRLGFEQVSVSELPLAVEVDDARQAMDLVSRATVRTRSLFEAQTPAAQAAIAAAVTDAVEEMRDAGRLTVPMPAMLITARRP
jgi:SAM-dependent methyltransferase